MKNKTRKFGKIWMINAIAKRAGFTRGDVRIILDTFIEIIGEIVSNKDCLTIAGLFRIYIKEIAPFEGYDAIRKIRMMVPTSYKVVMVSSGNLLDLVRKNKHKSKNNSTTPISQEEEVDSEYEE
jgi:nucleoid DNA-binding protein